MKTIRIYDDDGCVLFKHTCKGNTEEITVKEALKQGVVLKEAWLGFSNFDGASFKDANFEGSYLEGADFIEADCEGATFEDANLKFATFRGANLTNVNFKDVDLTYVDISEATLTGATTNMFCDKHVYVNITNRQITIGDETKTIEEWETFFCSDEEYNPPRGTEEFKRVEAMYKASKAYIETMNK